MQETFMNLPRIEPTPLSGWLWLLWWVGAIAIVVALFFIGVALIENLDLNVLGGIFVVGAIIVGIIAVAFPISSAMSNYARSSSYVRKEKEQKIEYDNTQKRNIKVLDYKGAEKYNYTGTFSYDMDDETKKINLTDNKTGNKISIASGDNDTVIVSDEVK